MTDYNLINEQLLGFSKAEANFLPLLSNASALLWQELKDINWAGFYLMHKGALLLGPFQGKPACINIKIGKGVCGTAVQTDKVQRVKDVHEFPGHIACDSASNSEIVIPLHKDGKIFGVLDIDSPLFDRFSEADEEGLLRFCRVLEEYIDLSDVFKES